MRWWGIEIDAAVSASRLKVKVQGNVRAARALRGGNRRKRRNAGAASTLKAKGSGKREQSREIRALWARRNVLHYLNSGTAR